MRGLLLESALMHSFSHAHILSLRGICLDPSTSCPYLIMPFMEHGDLRKFLRRKADSTDSSGSVTTYPQVANIQHIGNVELYIFACMVVGSLPQSLHFYVLPLQWS